MKHVKVGVAVALAMIATGLTTQSAFAFGISEHEQITHDALGFMRTDVVGDMDGEHTQADSGATLENKVHFDGCTFKEGSEFINSLYHDTIDELDPANPDADPWQAADDFGYLTHPTQDFYAHSNWVETRFRERPGIEGPGWARRGFGSVPTWFDMPTPWKPPLRRPSARAPPPSAKHTNGHRWRMARSMTRSIFEWLMPVCVPPHTE